MNTIKKELVMECTQTGAPTLQIHKMPVVKGEISMDMDHIIGLEIKAVSLQKRKFKLSCNLVRDEEISNLVKKERNAKSSLAGMSLPA